MRHEFEYARAMGIKRRELRATHSGRELRELNVLYHCEPWGERRGDLRVAHTAARFLNELAALLGRQLLRPYSASDFLIDFWSQHEGETAGADIEADRAVFAQVKRIAADVNATFGGKGPRDAPDLETGRTSGASREAGEPSEGTSKESL